MMKDYTIYSINETEDKNIYYIIFNNISKK